MKTKVKFNDLYIQWKCVEAQVQQRWHKLFAKSAYILGNDVQQFENNFAQYIGTKYACGVANGTDAIKIAIKAIHFKYQLGHTAILIPNNTYVATALAARHAQIFADLEFIDCDQYFQIDVRCLNAWLNQYRQDYKSCIILGVNLFGYSIDADSILKLCDKYNCILIEDSAQSHGTKTNAGNAGSVGQIAAFSMYPGKNLGALGDAGIITTSDQELNEICHKLRNMGASGKFSYDYIGYNSRLDTLQAIVLDEKLKWLDYWNHKRQKIVKWYEEKLPDTILPQTPPYCEFPTHHVYPIIIKDRDNIREYLTENGIQTGIHYPHTVTQTGQFAGKEPTPNADFYADHMLSLPIHPYLLESEVEYVCQCITNYL